MGGKSKKQTAMLKGIKPATEAAAKAIEQYIALRASMATLRAEMVKLSKIIQDEGCGYAHGYRTYVYRAPAWAGWAKKKAHTQLKVIAYKPDDESGG